ncbi:MAG: hypothetical protein ACTHN0_20165 [Aquihabitans sp.]
MTRRPVPRAVVAALGVLVLLAIPAAPAAADAPRPTDYRSTVTDVSPALPPGATVRVIGGDSLLELSLPEGHTATVADYPTSDDAEPVPYLRFDADGTVRRNALAVATTANQARYGTASTVPDPDADPRWETVATNGTYAWHDHRIHWMSPKAPRMVADDGQVDLGGDDGTWSVPIEVDEKPTVVTGELVLLSPPPVFAWAALVAAAVVVTLAVGTRFGLRGGSIAGVIASAGALLAANATWQAVPADAGGSPVPVIVAAVALVAALVGALAPPRIRLVAVAATAAALLGWGVLRWTVLARAVLPTTLAPWLDRTATAVAIGVGFGLAGLLVKGPARQPRSDAAPAVTASPSA